MKRSFAGSNEVQVIDTMIDVPASRWSPSSSSRVALCRCRAATPRTSCSFLPDRCSRGRWRDAREELARKLPQIPPRAIARKNAGERANDDGDYHGASARRRDACVRVRYVGTSASRGEAATSRTKPNERTNGRYARRGGRSGTGRTAGNTDRRLILRTVGTSSSVADEPSSEVSYNNTGF